MRQDLLSYVPWVILFLLALWLLSTGAQGVFSSNTIIGAIFAIIIFLVGFQLLTKTAATAPRGGPGPRYEEWWN
jgi:multisubunit Na+/H+ antiporter MnhE subunit